MKYSDVIPTFEALLAMQVAKAPSGLTRFIDNSTVYHYDEPAAVRWITRAEVALDSVFPHSHAVRQRWNKIVNHENAALYEEQVLDGARAVLQAALDVLKSGGLSTLVDGIRADTVGEVLDQADAFLSKGYSLAAAVLAGGALETHLRHLCTTHGVTWSGAGSISTYDGAISAARNQGTQVYSAGDTKLITAWGGIRNEAAHSPTSFQRNVKDIGPMVAGIREFVVRTS